MTAKIVDKKPKFKFLTPKDGDRFRFVDGFENSEEILRMKESKITFENEAYLFIRPDKNETDIEGYNIYVVLFAQLFTYSFFDLIDLSTQKLVKVHTYPFWLAYKKAYKEGRSFFKENYFVSGEVLYGRNGKVLERTIHKHYYHTDFNNFNEGWSYWERFSPLVFEMDSFAKYGYYGGIISSLNEYKKLHPDVFSKFAVCDDTNTHIAFATPKTNLALEELKRTKVSNKFNKNMPLAIPIDHFKVLFESKNKNGAPFLSESDFVKFIRSAFLGEPLKEKIKLKFGSGSKGQIISLFHRFYSIGGQYEKSLHVRDRYIHLLTDNFEGWNFEQVKQNFKSHNENRN